MDENAVELNGMMMGDDSSHGSGDQTTSPEQVTLCSSEPQDAGSKVTKLEDESKVIVAQPAPSEPVIDDVEERRRRANRLVGAHYQTTPLTTTSTFRTDDRCAACDCPFCFQCLFAPWGRPHIQPDTDPGSGGGCEWCGGDSSGCCYGMGCNDCCHDCAADCECHNLDCGGCDCDCDFNS